MTSNRSLLVIGGGILALVALAVAVVLLAENRGPVTFPPGSPEEAMQAYLTAWDAGDYTTAYDSFSMEVKSDHSLERFEQQARLHHNGFEEGIDRAIYIDSAEVTGDRATVYLSVEEYLGNAGESYRSPREVLMVREADGWKIDQPLLGIEVRPFGDPF